MSQFRFNLIPYKIKPLVKLVSFLCMFIFANRMYCLEKKNNFDVYKCLVCMLEKTATNSVLLVNTY